MEKAGVTRLKPGWATEGSWGPPRRRERAVAPSAVGSRDFYLKRQYGQNPYWG
jgi:hypothetical protein